jgi:hypothetical protein
MVLSFADPVFLVEHVFREGSRYTGLVQEQFDENFLKTPVRHRIAVRRLTEKFPEADSRLSVRTRTKLQTIHT